MEKQKIIELICKKLREDLEVALSAAKFAHETAIDEENIPDNKYDTISLEAAYLAEGEAKRVSEIEAAIKVYERVSLLTVDDSHAIKLHSLVDLVNQQGEKIRIFIGEEAGGVKFNYQGEPITIVTVKSPLGGALIGKGAGDVVEMSINNKITDYEIISTE